MTRDHAMIPLSGQRDLGLNGRCRVRLLRTSDNCSRLGTNIPITEGQVLRARRGAFGRKRSVLRFASVEPDSGDITTLGNLSGDT